MNATIEQRLDSLAQIVETIAGTVNKGGTTAKVETPLPPGCERVNLSTDICDFDFSAFEAKRGDKVVAIVRAPASVVKSGLCTPLATLTVRMASGKTPLAKVPFVKGQKSPAVEPAKLPTTKQCDLGNASEAGIATIATAAVNLERMAARSAALQSFYGFTLERGVEHCAAVLKPLLAHEPFPVGASDGQRIAHLRGLLAKHVAPQVEKIAPGQSAAAVADQTGKAGLTSTAILARHQLEKELVPIKVDGKWTVPGIGAYEQEWIESPALQREFPGGAKGAKCYAAYVRRCGKPQL